MTDPTRRRRQSHAPDGATQHRGWLGLVEISGPFLSLPVLRQAWPTLDALERPTREALRREHAIWRDAPEAGQAAWVRWVLAGLLGWGNELRESADELDDLAIDVAEHETRVVPFIRARRARRGRQARDDEGARAGLPARVLPDGAGARLAMGGDLRRSGRRAVPAPGRRAGPGHRRPLVGTGVGP